jgi:hypothetical protein
MYKYKNRHVVGQRANTRSQNIINSIQDKVNASAAMYTRARNALTKLSDPLGEHQWRTKLLVLAPEDIHPLKEGEAGESEGMRKLSWIWKVVGIAGHSEDEGLQEGVLIL